MSHDSPTAASLARSTVRARACRLCGQPLSALAQMRGEVCDAMDCRRRAADAITRERRAAALGVARASAARAWGQPALAEAPVLWLRHHDDDFTAPSPIDLAELRQHLLALEDEPIEPPALDDPEPPDAPLAGQLCALCRGRCCRFGLQGQAFLRAPQLRDWLAQHAGATWSDAVGHYLGQVAAEHLHSSCLFHGRAGCTLPRERRSQVCNEFACDTLEQLRDMTAAGAPAAVVVGIVASHDVRAAAVLTPQGARPLAAPR